MALSTLIRSWAEQQPERVALRFEGQETTWRRLWNRVERASARLASEWGVAPGERVAYLGVNRPEELILLFALARLGAVLVPLNTRLLEQEWLHLIDDSGARHLVCDGPFAAAAASLGSRTQIAVYRADALIAERCDARPEFSPVPGETPVLLVYTSGTSGAAKGVLHSQDGLLWNAAASIAAHDLTSCDHVLTVLPLFHVGGLCIQTIPALAAGATVTLHARFDAGAWLAEVEESRPSLSLMVPATLRAVIEHAHFDTADLRSLRALMAGSSTIPIRLLEAFHRRGTPVGQVYGSTETGPVSIVLPARDAMARVGKAGWSALHTEIRLVGADGGRVLPGAIGEILVRGRNNALGYWQSGGPVGFQDGWFRSGDLARQDQDGCFEIVGRLSDTIISGGEHIHPAELESLLAEQPGVAEAAVVGIKDAQWGESPVAAVVVRSGVSLEAGALLAVFEGRVARYKHPRQICFVDALPKNAMGKVRKSELAARLALLYGSGDAPP